MEFKEFENLKNGDVLITTQMIVEPELGGITVMPNTRLVIEHIEIFGDKRVDMKFEDIKNWVFIVEDSKNLMYYPDYYILTTPDYFVNLKQSRKLKLNKINGS